MNNICENRNDCRLISKTPVASLTNFFHEIKPIGPLLIYESLRIKEAYFLTCSKRFNQIFVLQSIPFVRIYQSFIWNECAAFHITLVFRSRQYFCVSQRVAFWKESYRRSNISTNIPIEASVEGGVFPDSEDKENKKSYHKKRLVSKNIRQTQICRHFMCYYRQTKTNKRRTVIFSPWFTGRVTDILYVHTPLLKRNKYNLWLDMRRVSHWYLVQCLIPDNWQVQKTNQVTFLMNFLSELYFITNNE